jgi:type IV pilus assembly protein PilE
MTLLELLTVMVVVAILATLAVTSYRAHVTRANRTDATSMLLRVQVAQEKYFLQNNTYADDLVTKLGFATDVTTHGKYKVTLAAAPGRDFTTSYVATATALGAQNSGDPQCHVLTVDDKGQRGSNPGPVGTCWR